MGEVFVAYAVQPIGDLQEGTEQGGAVITQQLDEARLLHQRFTTREMLDIEQRMEGAAAELNGRTTHAVALERRQAALAGAELGEEQRQAFGHVTRSRDLCVVVGYAGTGKSTMLGVARQAWEAQGYRVRGAALSGIAAEGLEAGSGIRSRTLASLEWAWKEGREGLSSRDVLVVDEAGMIGSRQMERVLSVAHEAGAKVVLVGDPEQLQAIEAGAAFRALAERAGAVEITEVRRQREAWQRDATRELATGRTGAALERYERAGMVHEHATQAEAREVLVAGWDAERRAAPDQSRVMLASTRADVAELNRLARERLRAAGELGPEVRVSTERGERGMAAGERVMFLRNERGLGAGPDGTGGVAVKNGTLGTVLAVEARGERLTVRLDGPGAKKAAMGEARASPDVVTFELGAYGHVEHGYAATVHKAQGVTVDRAHVLASRRMDRHAAYVALTRHRDGVALHWSAEAMGDRAGLTRTLGRERAKDVSLDYGESGPEPAHTAYAERRGLDPLRPRSEIVVGQAAERPGPGVSRSGAAQEAPHRPARGIERPEVAAGVAAWRGRYEADKQRRAHQAALEAQARRLAQGWGKLIEDYNAALPRIERDPELGGTRAALLGFGRSLREQPEAVEVLRRRGEEFGMAERPNLARLLGERDPERTLRSWLEGYETTMRAELKRERQAERKRQAELARQQAQKREAERSAPRRSYGPSLG